ncbi:hypothetical protein LAZ67_1004314 [Cordylochernes scorpioides]|uniref:Integrase catalytic domain-containing protein n=1 Tax=Cordylochernes scorpioides TaxID=51811 RepID=A0ABY6K0F8_9ARAC|nr:hypothetical protein LAZ67_1004314 [Cordylochernes scorpioides]
MRRVAAKFVPKLLNCDQIQHRMNIANEILDSVRDDPTICSRGGVVHHEFLPQGRTVMIIMERVATGHVSDLEAVDGFCAAWRQIVNKYEFHVISCAMEIVHIQVSTGQIVKKYEFRVISCAMEIVHIQVSSGQIGNKYECSVLSCAMEIVHIQVSTGQIGNKYLQDKSGTRQIGNKYEFRVLSCAMEIVHIQDKSGTRQIMNKYEFHVISCAMEIVHIQVSTGLIGNKYEFRVLSCAMDIVHIQVSTGQIGNKYECIVLSCAMKIVHIQVSTGQIGNKYEFRVLSCAMEIVHIQAVIGEECTSGIGLTMEINNITTEAVNMQVSTTEGCTDRSDLFHGQDTTTTINPEKDIHTVPQLAGCMDRSDLLHGQDTTTTINPEKDIHTVPQLAGCTDRSDLFHGQDTTTTINPEKDIHTVPQLAGCMDRSDLLHGQDTTINPEEDIHTIDVCHIKGCKDMAGYIWSGVNRGGSSKSPTVQDETLANLSTSPDVLLPTLRVTLKGNRTEKTARAIIDTGSQRSYILHSTAMEMEYEQSRREFFRHSLFGGSSTDVVEHEVYTIHLSDINNSYRCEFEALGQPLICGSIPPVCPRSLLEGNEELDVSDLMRDRIEVLIGADIAGRLLTDDQRRISSGLVAIRTKLGWTVMGKIPPTEVRDDISSLCVTTLLSLDLENLWKLDAIGVSDAEVEKKTQSLQAEMEEHFAHTTTRDIEGRYEVALPWVQDKERIPSNKDLAENQLSFQNVEETEKFVKESTELLSTACFNLRDWDSYVEKTTLHIFCDASQFAYATCIFLRIEKEDRVDIQLIQARTRVAPLKKLTIPRLELLACLIGARLAANVIQDLEFEEIPRFYWTDSTNALCWIQREDNWAAFVMNRVKEIHNISSPESWRHIPGRLNPADLPSRGCSAESLKETRWWEGPAWLKVSQEEWPKSTIIPDLEIVYSERRKTILNTLKTVKKIINQCIRCKRFTATPATVESTSLPEDRERDAAVFEIVGVDLTGHLILKNKKKAWIVIFTCAVYRGVHLELVTSLSMEAFLQAFRRFIARRGRPLIVYSDNGTNFKGMANALKKIDFSRLKCDPTLKNITWKFIPPGAPWWGGWWERLIGMMKQLLFRILGQTSLGYEELSTVMCDVESLMNTRPLTYLTEESEDLAPLTPSLFLHEVREVGVPDLDLIDNQTLSRKYQYIKRVREDLRERFRIEYFGFLRQETKRLKTTIPFKVGDMVLIGQESLKRLHWPLARIIQLYPGKDGLVRVAKVKTSSGDKIRPIQKLYNLEITPEISRRDPLTERSPTQEVRLTTEEDPLTSQQEQHHIATPNVVSSYGRPIKRPNRLDLLNFSFPCLSRRDANSKVGEMLEKKTSEAANGRPAEAATGMQRQK